MRGKAVIYTHLLCREIQAHVPEQFWAIHMEYKPPEQGSTSVSFSWDRTRLFDHAMALLFYEPCVEAPEATITKVLGCNTQNLSCSCQWQIEGRKRNCFSPHSLSTLERSGMGLSSCACPESASCTLLKSLPSCARLHSQASFDAYI